MGYYINPPDMTKEAWLMQHALAAQRFPPKRNTDFDAAVVVCLVQNPDFTAAGICYSQAELERFAQPDSRPKSWFLVPVTDLQKVMGVGMPSIEGIDA